MVQLPIFLSLVIQSSPQPTIVQCLLDSQAQPANQPLSTQLNSIVGDSGRQHDMHWVIVTPCYAIGATTTESVERSEFRILMTKNKIFLAVLTLSLLPLSIYRVTWRAECWQSACLSSHLYGCLSATHLSSWRIQLQCLKTMDISGAHN